MGVVKYCVAKGVDNTKGPYSPVVLHGSVVLKRMLNVRGKVVSGGAVVRSSSGSANSDGRCPLSKVGGSAVAGGVVVGAAARAAAASGMIAG